MQHNTRDRLDYRDSSNGNFEENTYAIPLNEYKVIMSISNCYVCTYFLYSVSEGIVYIHLPLFYGISCSCYVSLLLGQDFLEEFKVDYNLAWSWKCRCYY